MRMPIVPGENSLFVNANHYYSDQKLKSGDHIYINIKIQILLKIYSLSDVSSHTFHLFPWNRATLNHLENEMALNCMYRISSNKRPRSDKHPPPDKRPLPWPIYKQPPSPPPPSVSLPSLDGRDTRITSCYWHFICIFFNFNFSGIRAG